MNARAAGIYAQKLRWHVLPLHDVSSGACSCGKPDCPSAGKHPRIREWQNEASTAPAQIAAWWSQWPAAGIGIATGAPSGFFVLDVDGPTGAASLAALLELHGPLPLTASARTGSGGTHYLFAHDPAADQRNSAGKLGQGLDTRGTGGQIVVSPSVSAKGTYSWIVKPWITPPAPAPAWLIAALRPAAVTPGQSATERGYFPAASPEVLDAAAAALERHGPAVQGAGGDAHTFVAGALLIHDHALTENEAWPLLCEWNETCSPPWSEADLAAKMRGGAKYATGAYGSRRSLDALQTGAKVITDWQAAPGEIMPLVRRVREIAAATTDPTERAILTRDAAEATGLKPGELALPHGQRDALPEGSIVIGPVIHEIANQAIASLEPVIFARNGVLCEVVKAERTFISDLETPRIQDLMSQEAPYFIRDDKGDRRAAPPLPIAQLLHSRRTHPPGVRVLEAITTAPVFLADGSILSQRGYNAAARVFLEPSVTVDVPDAPTLEDAIAAVAVFSDLLSDFDFATPADFSSWLAGVLSPLVKAATGNAPAPLICVSASSPGAGKTLLVDVVARIVTGGSAEVRPYQTRDQGEWGKRLTAFVKAASPVSVFDNCNGPIGDEAIDRLITSSTWSDRILGASDAPPLPNVTTWFATGNNIEPQGDTVRRCLVVRIEVDTERPQERSGFRYPLLADHAGEHRSELLTAALTILRAYHCAGRPEQRLPSWGSFTAWSSLVRGALVWAGCADPFGTQQRATAALNEPDNDAHDFWIAVIDSLGGGTASTIAAEAGRSGAGEVLGLRDSINGHNLRAFVGRFVDKPRAGKRIRRDGHSYYVEVIPQT